MAEVCHAPTIAARQAERNLRANLNSLRNKRTPGAAICQRSCDPACDWEWVFARDGSLTALDGQGRFVGGCSVPTRAAKLQLAKFSAAGSSLCLLAPSHPAEVRVLLDRMRPEQALIVLTPELEQLALLLHGDDFSTAIDRDRLWLAAGEEWSSRLEHLLHEHAGLAIPTQFVRLKSAEATVDGLIEPAQAVFTRVAAARSAAMARLAEEKMASIEVSDRICVLAGSRFRLWNDAGYMLASTLRGQGSASIVHFDPDEPLSATPLALAKAARECGAIVSADVCRADAPAAVAPMGMPWITWITRPRAIPPISSAGPRDRLLVANESLGAAAEAAGWVGPRVSLAGWPSVQVDASDEPPALGLIADIPALAPPEQLRNFSSHRLLWEWVESTMRRDPLAAVDSAERIVQDGAHRLGITPADLPIAMFIDGLIAPMLAIGVARLLHSADVPLRLFGDGWEAVEGLADLHARPVRTRGQLVSAVRASRALVRAFVSSEGLAIDAVQRPMLRLRNRMSSSELAHAARAALNDAPVRSALSSMLSAELICRVRNR